MKLTEFWVKWKFKLIAGVAILAALAIAIFAAHHIGYNKGKHISTEVIQKYESDKNGLQAQLNIARGKIDTRVVTEFKDRIIYRDRIQYENRDVIRTVVVTRPADQTLSKGWIYAHNQSALGQSIDPALAANAAASGISDPKVLETINDNYGICRGNAIQLEALQKWAKETYEATQNARKTTNR